MSGSAVPSSVPVGVVVIGRNEGDRLRRCLKSLAGYGGPVAYVDSGSSDDSVATARLLGATAIELDPSLPFSAARGRNEGFWRVARNASDAKYVQFVDGDCELSAGWLERAASELDRRPDVAAVCGRLRERFPDASVYNRLCEMEWNAAIGEVEACGGIAMYRVSHLHAVGGFDTTLPSGEEPELCARLRQRGWKIVRLADEMGWHDAAMLRFSQWWWRQIRSGHGALNVSLRFGLPEYRRQTRSALMWGIGWPLAAILGGAAVGRFLSARAGVMTLAMLLAVGLLQIVRISHRGRRYGLSWPTSLAYGTLTLLSKWAQVLGQARFCLDRAVGRHARLIEHKRTPETSATR